MFNFLVYEKMNGGVGYCPPTPCILIVSLLCCFYCYILFPYEFCLLVNLQVVYFSCFTFSLNILYLLSLNCKSLLSHFSDLPVLFFQEKCGLDVLLLTFIFGTFSDTDGENFREDLPEIFGNREAMLAAAPSYEEPYIKVPKVLNKE